MVAKEAPIVVEHTPKPTIETYFCQLEDPRSGINCEHQFLDVLVITICGVICGADDWVAIECFGKAKESWFRQFLALPSGIPSHDTFWRIFRSLDTEQFQACFLDWMQALRHMTAGEVIAVDGKKLRRSFAREDHKAAIHMVSAWASTNGLVLGQRKIVLVNPDRNPLTGTTREKRPGFLSWYLRPIVVAEIKHLIHKGHFQWNLEHIPSVIQADPRCLIAPINLDVVAHAPNELDIHDSLIVGVALAHLQPVDGILTLDRAIAASSLVVTVW